MQKPSPDYFGVAPLGHDGLIPEPSRGYPPARIMRFSVLLGLSLASLLGCATYRDDLVRGQHYYDLNQYNDALAVWRILEIDWDSLSYSEQTRYAYLRGMTDYRMGFRADSRHWLAISKAVELRHPGGLDAQSSVQMEQALGELNSAVYAAGQPPSASATGQELANVTANPALPTYSAAPQTQSPAPVQMTPATMATSTQVPSAAPPASASPSPPPVP